MMLKNKNSKKVGIIIAVVGVLGMLSGGYFFKMYSEPKSIVENVAIDGPQKISKEQFIEQNELDIKYETHTNSKEKSLSYSNETNIKEHAKTTKTNNDNAKGDDSEILPINELNNSEDKEYESLIKNRKSIKHTSKRNERFNVKKAAKKYYEFLSSRNDLKDYDIFDEFKRNYENYLKNDNEMNFIQLRESTQAVEISLKNLFEN